MQGIQFLGGSRRVVDEGSLRLTECAVSATELGPLHRFLRILPRAYLAALALWHSTALFSQPAPEEPVGLVLATQSAKAKSYSHR